jgi:hypothetical protein
MVGEQGTTVHEDLLDVADVMVRRNELPIHRYREFAFRAKRFAWVTSRS